MRPDWQRYWLAMGLLLLANLLLIWGVGVLPGQDLPQHLTYAHIFAAYDDANLPLRDFYVLPERFQPYFTIYLVLAHLARVINISNAIRLVLSCYALATLASFHCLVRAVWPMDKTASPPWAGLLGSLIIWNPSVCMGFLSYYLCMPFVFAGTAAALQLSTAARRKAWLALGLCVAGAASMHVVAAAALVCIVGLLAVSHRTRRAWQTFGVAAAAMVGTALLWHATGDVLGDSFHFNADPAEAIKRAHAFDFLTTIFDITWYDPLVKLSYMSWHVFGPYRFTGMLLNAFFILTWVAILAQNSKVTWRDVCPNSPIRLTAIAFWMLAYFAPFGIKAPQEVTFIDLRLFSIASALLLASLTPRLFHSRSARNALIAFCFAVLGHFMVNTFAFSRLEAEPALELMQQAKTPAIMAPIMTRDRSDYFGKLFRLNHFVPMYYTLLQNGISSQFWAQYVAHLPIGYRQGMDVHAPDDWDPGSYSPGFLSHVDYVLLRRANFEDDGRGATYMSSRIENDLAQRTQLVACADAWCLFKSVH